MCKGCSLHNMLVFRNPGQTMFRGTDHDVSRTHGSSQSGGMQAPLVDCEVGPDDLACSQTMPVGPPPDRRPRSNPPRGSSGLAAKPDGGGQPPAQPPSQPPARRPKQATQTLLRPPLQVGQPQTQASQAPWPPARPPAQVLERLSGPSAPAPEDERLLEGLAAEEDMLDTGVATAMAAAAQRAPRGPPPTGVPRARRLLGRGGGEPDQSLMAGVPV